MLLKNKKRKTIHPVVEEDDLCYWIFNPGGVIGPGRELPKIGLYKEYFELGLDIGWEIVSPCCNCNH